MSESGDPIVTAVYPEQHDQAAVSLGRAFINDPAFKVILPDITEPAAPPVGRSILWDRPSRDRRAVARV